jgi:hemoglobin
MADVSPADPATPVGSTAPAARTAYDRIGGAPTVSAVVEQFFDRVVADPQLRRYFHVDGDPTIARTDPARLREHFTTLVATLLGAPVRYEGRNLAEAHRGLGVCADDYDRMSDLFLATLSASGVPDDIGAVVAEKFAALKPLIVEVFRPARVPA